MTDNHKMMCGCSLCNTSNYFQESLNTWRRKNLKIMKDKADNSCGSKKDELTQFYKSYADYSFPDDDTRHLHCENAVEYVICSRTNDECQFPNWKYVLRKCTDCTYISLPGFERNSSNQSPMVTFNKYMTQFCFSHHGILIRENITTYLYAKGTSKRLVSYVKNNTIQESWLHRRNTVWESKTFFQSTQGWWFPQRLLYSKNWKISLPPQLLKNIWKTSCCWRYT